LAKEVRGKKSQGIAAWPEGERPRERLLRLGPQTLTDAELLAIMLRIGFAGTSAVDLGRQLIVKFGSLRAVTEAPLHAVRDIKGLRGKDGAKAAQLAAALEIARRIAVQDASEKPRIKGTEEATARIQPQLRGLPEEHFRALFLNRRNALLEDALLAVGSVDQARPPVRLIVTRALQANASAVILAHNHPSGAAEASESDRIFTQNVFAALKPIGVKLLDHIIVGTDTVFSFADSGEMDEIELAMMTG
jgi:DNA repair protein RadC